MATIVEIEKLALNLPEKERATLAANLLESLPGVLSDEDEGVAEALRRDAEIDANPDQAISLAQLDAQIKESARLMRLEFHNRSPLISPASWITTKMSQAQSLRTSSIPSCNSILRRQPTLLNLTAFASVISDA